MPNVLHGLAGRLNRVPADALNGATTGFRVAAERRGGRIKGQQLTAVVRDRKTGPGAAQATVAGSPAGLWVWAEDGTRPHRIRPRAGRVLAGQLGHPVSVPIIHPGITPPPLRWTAAMRDAENVVADATAVALERAVG